MELNSTGKTATAPYPSQREQLFELLVFLSLIVPSMVISLLAVHHGSISFVLTAWATIARDLSLVGLVAFFLWRNGEPFHRIGWSLKNTGQEVVVGTLLFVVMFVSVGYINQLFRAAGLTSPSTPLPKFLDARGWEQYALAGVLVVIVAIAEETIFRGYLILRLTSLTGSAAAAVFLSSFIFSLGHGYEGSAGVATVGVMGVLFALVYIWRGSLVAPMVMHFLQDFLGIVVLPLVLKK